MDDYGVGVWDDLDVDEEEFEDTIETRSRPSIYRGAARMSPLEARRAVEDLMETRHYQSLHEDYLE